MSDYYEDQTILSEYLLFHYGEKEQILPWEFGPKTAVDFPKRIAHQFASHYPKNSPTGSVSVLDIGCAVGRTAFELSMYADSVLGIDYSHAFVNAANSIKASGELEYEYKIQGNLRNAAVARVDDALDRQKVSFEQGNAMELSADQHGRHDIIIASNLICRLPDPKVFFETLPSLMKPGGVFVLSSPYTWLEDFTSKDKWLDGPNHDLHAFEAIKSIMAVNFELLDQADVPMLIYEHQRKYQWTVCHGSVWKLKS